MKRAALTWAPVGWGAFALIALAGSATAGPHDALISKHASTYGVPETLVRRVIHIESKGNARIVSKGNYGLMQIRLGTAHSMGYRGTAEEYQTDGKEEEGEKLERDRGAVEKEIEAGNVGADHRKERGEQTDHDLDRRKHPLHHLRLGHRCTPLVGRNRH